MKKEKKINGEEELHEYAIPMKNRREHNVEMIRIIKRAKYSTGKSRPSIFKANSRGSKTEKCKLREWERKRENSAGFLKKDKGT